MLHAIPSLHPTQTMNEFRGGKWGLFSFLHSPAPSTVWSESYFSPETAAGQSPAYPSIYHSPAGLSLAPEQLQVWFSPVQTNHRLEITAVRLIRSTKLNPSLWRRAIRFCTRACFSPVSDSACVGAHRCSGTDAAATAGQIQTPPPRGRRIRFSSDLYSSVLFRETWPQIELFQTVRLTPDF